MGWDNTNISEFIELALAQIKRDCFLSEKNEAVISEFFHFCVNQKNASRTVPYSLLIEYENKKIGLELAVKLANIWNSL